MHLNNRNALTRASCAPPSIRCSMPWPRHGPRSPRQGGGAGTPAARRAGGPGPGRRSGEDQGRRPVASAQRSGRHGATAPAGLEGRRARNWREAYATLRPRSHSDSAADAAASPASLTRGPPPEEALRALKKPRVARRRGFFLSVIRARTGGRVGRVRRSRRAGCAHRAVRAPDPLPAAFRPHRVSSHPRDRSPASRAR